MKAKNINGTYYIRVDKNEGICEMILKVCQDYHITGGYIQGIGTC